MTNDELRLRIAELKGWVEVSEQITTPTRDGKEFTYTHKTWKTPTGEVDGSDPKFWPTDPAAALGLVEEAANNGIGFELYTIHEDKRHWYHAQFYDPPGGPMVEPYDAEDDSLFRSICLSYIAWKESQ